MKTLFRLPLSVGLLGAVIAGGSYACPRLSSRLGLNGGEWLEVQRQLEQEQRRGETLSRKNRVVLAKLQTKVWVIAELRAGRLTLLEAAARFRDLGTPEIEAYRKWFQRAFPARTEDERWCRQVIYFVRQTNPLCADWAKLANDLEAELVRRLAEGPLHLPEYSG